MVDNPNRDDQPTVEVVGVGTAEVVPDRLQVNLAASAHAASVLAAMDAADSGLRAMLAALREREVADEDIRSTTVELQPHYRGDGRPSGFDATMGVLVVLRDLATAGALVAAAVEAGGDASRVHGLSLAATTSDEAMSAARDGAWADATARAAQYAALAGRSLGAVLSVSELGRAGDPMLGLASRRASVASLHVEPGSQSVHAAIAVRWELV
jgi:uncharacterized protein YggE